MAAPRVIKKEVEEVEDKGALAVYQEMRVMLEELYKATLPLESNEMLAALIQSLDMVKMKIDTIVEYLQNEAQMEVDRVKFEEREVDING